MAFGLRYWAELQSRFKGVHWRVEIAERTGEGGLSGNSGTSSIAGGTGNTATSGTATLAPEELRFDGSNPLKVTWERRGDEFFVPVKASEATVNILCTENFRYIGLFTSDPRRFRVSVFRNGALFWRGYVVADLYSENFAAPPYQVSIKAVDGFNLLQSIPFRNPDGTQLTGRRGLWSLVEMCIEVLELDLDVADWMDLYAEGMNRATKHFVASSPTERRPSAAGW
jgi:hypothetical protein